MITTVSGKVVQNLNQQPNLTITNFLSKNEVKSKLRDIVQIPSDAVETEFSSETVVYKKKMAIIHSQLLLHLLMKTMNKS